MSLTSLFKNQINLSKRELQARFELSLLLAEKSRSHTEGEELLKMVLRYIFE